MNKDREIGEIKVKVNEIHKMLLGNGQPGLVQNFNKMTSRLDKFEGGLNVVKGLMWIFGTTLLGSFVWIAKQLFQ